MDLQIIESHKCHGGLLQVVEHSSSTLGCTMKFSIFMPKEMQNGSVPLLTFLSGLTCTHENFTTKGNAYQAAAKHGVCIVAPDTSPRGDHIADEDRYDFGKGAGFYIDAIQKPWSDHYKMETYITDELQRIVAEKYDVLVNKQGIFGHSMGGHGALTLYLKYPDLYKSCSAFSPIVSPATVPWGQYAFERYIGDDENEWQKHDACYLMKNAGDRSEFPDIRIDQGTDDQFLDEQLRPDLFEKACVEKKQKLHLNMHDGYDHSYYFIQSFMDQHIELHAKILKTNG